MEISKKTILISGLPKVDINGLGLLKYLIHKNKIKRAYYLTIKSQCKDVFNKSNQHVVSYNFGFKKNPLSSISCSVMANFIHSILFENDKYDIVRSVTLSSNKHTSDQVLIIVETIKK